MAAEDLTEVAVAMVAVAMVAVVAVAMAVEAAAAAGVLVGTFVIVADDDFHSSRGSLASVKSSRLPGHATCIAISPSTGLCFIGVGKAVGIVNTDGSLGSHLDMGGTVTAVCCCGDYLFVAYAAPVESRTVADVGLIRGWNVRSAPPTEVPALVVPGLAYAHKQPITALYAFQPPSEPVPVVVSGSADATLLMWRFAADRRVYAPTELVGGHVRAIRAAIFSAGRLISVGEDGHVVVWNLGSPAAPTAVILPSRNRHGAPIMAICEIAVDATPRFVTADESGVISGWTLDKPGVTDAAMVPDDATEPFTANKLTGFSVINVAGYRFPLVACGYRNGSVVLKDPMNRFSVVANKDRSTAHREGPVLICAAPAGIPGMYSVAAELNAWSYTGPEPGAMPPAAGGPAAAAAAAAASSMAPHMPAPAIPGMPATPGAMPYGAVPGTPPYGMAPAMYAPAGPYGHTSPPGGIPGYPA